VRRHVPAAPGVVDEDLGLGVGDQRLDVLRRPHVGAHESPADLASRPLAGFAVDVREDDDGSFGCESLGDRATGPGGCARDDCRAPPDLHGAEATGTSTAR
jgi:hypothetical protein